MKPISLAKSRGIMAISPNGRWKVLVVS